MKSSAGWLLLILLSIRAMGQETVVNDPNAQKRVTGNFSAISVSGGIDLYLSQGTESEVAVSAADARYRDRIKTEVEGNTLKIWYDGKDLGWVSGKKNLRAYISFKNIDRLEASGASNSYVNGKITAERLDIRLSGASDFKGIVDAGELGLHLSGASDVTMKGRANHLNIESSGASDVKADDFVVQYCDAVASGSSDIRLTVDKEINAVASGSSDIRFRGNGVTKKISSSGGGTVKKM